MSFGVDRREFLIGLGAGAGLLTSELLLDSAHAAPRRGPPLPFPELTLRGSPGQIGLTHGRTFAKQVRHNVGFYLRWFEQVIKLPKARALSVAGGFAEVMRKHTPTLLEEIDGIAKGAKVSRAAVLALNARTDMLVVGRSKRARGKKQASAAPPAHELARPGCTALALSGGSARRPSLALGQNWDWRKELAGNIVVLRVQRKGAPRLVTFTEAGMVGKIGFNERRLGVCLNFLGHKTEDPEGRYGVPVHVLLRAVMECQSLEQAAKLIAWVPRCASANFLMAQHDARRGGAPQALDVEWTPSAMAKLPMQAGQLVHTNHFRDGALRPGCDSGFGKSTMNRFKVASARAKTLAKRLKDPATRMRTILADREGAPYSVSKTSAKGSSSQTLAGVVMDLTGNRIYLCAGQPHKGRFIKRPGV
jgi:isopenicillin-N N-acyltransferase-like protein